MKKKLNKVEIIGKNIEVTSSKNKANSGLKGKIIDETKNTIKIKTNKGEKTLIKKNITFKMKTNNEEIMINGADINAAPEERIKLR